MDPGSHKECNSPEIAIRLSAEVKKELDEVIPAEVIQELDEEIPVEVIQELDEEIPVEVIIDYCGKSHSDSELEPEEDASVKVQIEADEEIFRCETQMIKTYIRREQKDPDTQQVTKVTHAFSFCNHADLPEDVLEKVIRDRWKDLFALTGTKHSSMPAELPERIKIIDNSVPDVEVLFPPKTGLDDSCNFCDWKGLQELTKYHLHKEMGAEDQTKKQ